jgi:hypothetical protein
LLIREINFFHMWKKQIKGSYGPAEVHNRAKSHVTSSPANDHSCWLSMDMLPGVWAQLIKISWLMWVAQSTKVLLVFLSRVGFDWVQFLSLPKITANWWHWWYVESWDHAISILKVLNSNWKHKYIHRSGCPGEKLTRCMILNKLSLALRQQSAQEWWGWWDLEDSDHFYGGGCSAPAEGCHAGFQPSVIRLAVFFQKKPEICIMM